MRLLAPQSLQYRRFLQLSLPVSRYVTRPCLHNAVKKWVGVLLLNGCLFMLPAVSAQQVDVQRPPEKVAKPSGKSTFTQTNTRTNGKRESRRHSDHEANERVHDNLPQDNITHVPAPKFPYEADGDSHSDHKPPHRHPYWGDKRYYDEQPVKDSDNEETEFVTDKYQNCYRVEYNGGFRELVPVRAKYCRP